MTTVNIYRLPENPAPEKYELTLTPDVNKSVFAGQERITLRVDKPIDKISINSVELEIQRCELIQDNGTILTPDEIIVDDSQEIATFTFSQTVKPGIHYLDIWFSGVLNDQLRGFYRSQYYSSDGEIRYIATTQFEATDARRAFPCWDDPAVKAVFNVTLVIPNDLVAVSNTMIESETDTGNLKTVRFFDTPKMSTYLLAFIVGDLACVEQKANNGTLVRVWATKGKEQHGYFALENSVRMLAYFNNYFNIPYPLDKLDHLAIPDFAAGAMENWGAITYRETALLYDPQNSSAGTRQRIMEVVAHEMAHMWFGDLVTMEWWNDLWLNESFASWMGDKAVDNIFPEWEQWTQFVFQDTNTGLSLDGLRNSHPIEAHVEDPNQIRELFDAISYSKGGAVLRMLEDFLGEETFRQGLYRYLDTHQYGNARTEDLWAALEVVSGQPVTEIMNSWVKQMGYPFISVEIEENSSDTNVTLTQERFLYDHLLYEDKKDPTTWQIPVSIATSTGNKISLLMEDSRKSATFNKVASSQQIDWIKVNFGQTGFYRVNYPANHWSKIKDAVRNQQLSAVDRLGVQNDSYALVRAGHLPATEFLKLADSYKSERDSSVWGDLSSNLKGMENLIIDESYLDNFQEFARGLFQGLVSHVGWQSRESEGHLDSILRTIALGQAGSYGDMQVVNDAKAKFEEFLTDQNSLHPDLRGAVYSIVAQEGDVSTYDTLWQLEKNAELHEERVRILGALTRFQQKDILEDVLQKSLSEDIRSQDSVLVIVSLAANRFGRRLAWEFIKDNWEEFDRRYGGGGFALMRLVSISGGFTTLEMQNDVQEFFRLNPAPSAQRTIQQSIERIGLNIAWLSKNRDGLAKWFSQD